MWDSWIVPIIEEIYNQTNEDFRCACNVEKRNLNDIKYKAEKYYQAKRTELKESFYGNRFKSDFDAEYKMDSHKISAILCRTLMEYKVFTYDIAKCEKYIKEHKNNLNTEWMSRNALMNYRLAFYVSVMFLYRSMLYEYKESSYKLYRELKNNKTLYFYKADKNNKITESFESSIILDLAKRDVSNRSFDCLMFSLIMYQLEEYNKSKIKDIIKQKEDKGTCSRNETGYIS